jgi:hypothetical protein
MSKLIIILFHCAKIPGFGKSPSFRHDGSDRQVHNTVFPYQTKPFIFSTLTAHIKRFKLIRLFKRDGRDSKRELPTLEWASATLRFCFVCQFFLLPFDFCFLWWAVAQLKADFAMRIIRVWYFLSVHNIPAMKSEPSSQVNHTSRQRWTNTNVSLRIQLKNDVEILF